MASSPLANEVALISGQGPTQQTAANCPTYTYIDPGTTGKQQQVRGDGCIYPQTTETLPQQFLANGLSWKAYVQGIGEGSPGSSTTTASSTTTTTSTTPTPTTTPAPTSSTTSSTSSTDPVDTIGAATCPHPALNGPSLNQSVSADSTYVNWKNPVIYFQGLLLASGECQTNDVGIAQLANDLKNPGATPTFSYISPDPCDDGSDTPCRPGAKAGLAQADMFLQRVVPEIERSASYKQNGLILITFASAPQSGPHWDTSSCCGQPTYPNLPSTSTTGTGSTSSSSSSSSSTSDGPGAPRRRPPLAPRPRRSRPRPRRRRAPRSPPGRPPAPRPPARRPAATRAPPRRRARRRRRSSPTTSSSTTTSATTTPGECGPVIVGTPPGGGQVGLLMISPWIAANQSDVVDTLNHFSVLKGIEQLFKLPNLGYAKVDLAAGIRPGMFATSKH